MGCLEMTPAHVEFGHDYNGYQKRVMDTTSSFKLNDPFAMQLYNEKDFGVDSIDCFVFKGTREVHGELVFQQKLAVDSKSGFLIVRGASQSHLTARGFLRTSTTGSYYIEFRSGAQVLSGKELQLHSSKE